MKNMAGSKVAKTRVLIVDDHPMTRDGLALLINQQPELEVCCEAKSAAQALQAVLEKKPGLVLADFTLRDKNAIELIKDIKAVRPGLPVLVVSMHDEALYADRVLRAGGRGYVSKAEGGEKILQAIRRVLDGKIHVSESMASRILESFSGAPCGETSTPVEQLSDREFEVFDLLGDGVSTRQIATRLHLSPKTVDAHRARIKEKLNLKTTAELVAYAARWAALRERTG